MASPSSADEPVPISDPAADDEEVEAITADAPAPDAVPTADSPPPIVEPAVLFERPPTHPKSQFPLSPGFTNSPVVPTGEAGSSLFDRYASEETQRSGAGRGNRATKTSFLAQNAVKVTCSLNTEANRGRSYTIQLPETCDTIGEVCALIQRKMQLDSRMLYAAELFNPDGSKIKSFKELAEAAALDTQVIVGCGEPFDHSTVPQSMLSFHLHGGGRTAAKTVKKELAEKKYRAAQLKADQVRASGHGLSSAAAQSAKAAAAEANRQAAAVMRHDYMNQLISRSAQQNELIRHVQANNARLRAERQRREQAGKSVWSQERLQELSDTRRKEASAWRKKHEAEEMNAAKLIDHAKRVRMTGQAEGKLAKTQLNEQRKAAGLERRMSYISRSVEKAAQDDMIVKNHQVKKAERKRLLLGLRSVSSVPVSMSVSQSSRI